MVKLSRGTELSDTLNVLAATERELDLTLTTDRPLRKPRTTLQTKELAELRREVAAQIFDQLSERARRSFRGPIAVEMHLGLPAGRHSAQLSTAVKAYIDALKGPVVFDDATVAHLLVLRGRPPVDGVQVRVRCLPLRLFAADYDRAFRVLPEYEDVTAAPATVSAAEGPFATEPWGYRHFDRHDMDRLRSEENELRYLRDLDADEAEQLAEDPDADIDLNLPYDKRELEDWQVRDSLRMHLENAIAEARGDWLTDQGLDARDRPGPAPAWLDETRALGSADVLELEDGGPGCIIVPAPRWPGRTRAGEPTWNALVEGGFLAARSRADAEGPPAFRGPIALDIALRGGAGSHRDIDNVARDVLRIFSGVFGPSRPQVIAYRIYRQEWPEADVRIRIMPAVRLAVLARGMDRAREVARTDRGQRTRE